MSLPLTLEPNTTDHCLDYLRQVVMCNVDVTPRPVHWDNNKNRPISEFEVEHTCRDFWSVREWARERSGHKHKFKADGSVWDPGIPERRILLTVKKISISALSMQWSSFRKARVIWCSCAIWSTLACWITPSCQRNESVSEKIAHPAEIREDGW